MTVVVDVNVIAASILPLPYSVQATRKLKAWKQSDTDLRAPMLLQYELAAVLRKAIVAGWLTTRDAVETIATVLNLRIGYVPPSVELHNRALHWAEMLGQTTTYDAHYLALAEMTGCPFWTSDERLFNAVHEKLSWVHCLGNFGANEDGP